MCYVHWGQLVQWFPFYINTLDGYQVESSYI